MHVQHCTVYYIDEIRTRVYTRNIRIYTRTYVSLFYDYVTCETRDEV